MLKLLVKNIFRNLFKNTSISLSNLFGLILGFVAILFITSWVYYETNYDQHFDNSSRLYRLTKEFNNGGNQSHFARIIDSRIRHIPEFFPEVEQMVRLSPGRNSSLKIGENKIETRKLFATDSNFFEVFNMKLSHGNTKTVLDNPNTAVISKSFADKYFSGKNPIGKEIMWSHQFDTSFHSYTVNGIMPDFPANSHFHPEVLVSFKNPEDYNQWFYTYILLKNNAQPGQVLAKFDAFKEKYYMNSIPESTIFHIQNVKDIHLHSHKDREIEANGDIRSVRIIAVVGIVLLLVVFINFLNFQLISFQEKFKFQFVSKSLGAKKYFFYRYLLVEGLTLITFASFISLVIYLIFIKYILNWIGINLYIDSRTVLVLFALVYLLFATLALLISSYPVFFLNFYKKIRVLGQNDLQKPVISFAGNEHKLRRGLVLLQFTGCICLIISTIVLLRQNNYLMNNRLGKDQDNIINLINIPRASVDNYEIFKSELLKYPEILDVTGSLEEPGGETMDGCPFELEGEVPEEIKSLYVGIFPVDHNFNQFYGNKILVGEDLFEKEGKQKNKYVINEAALSFFGYQEPSDIIGKRFQLKFNFPGFFEEGYIAGVVEDFHLTTMEKKDRPLVLYYQNYWNFCISIKYAPDKLPRVLKTIKSVWHKVNPDYAVQPHFISDLYNRLYFNQLRQEKLVGLLAGLAIIISCLGLYGIVIFITNKRIKEIGVRKVNGAKSSEIIILLNKQFLTWVALSFIIACPIAFYMMKRWLENFEYKIEINWWIFVLAGAIALLIALITISLQSWKAARRNPVEALRYE